ncbi:uncharacterized protein LOC130961179 isoform X2 [Arachis stenosperma]|uniref:uncharacterized protein LOC130936045 isoform X2 n=1 Tax=Arachis stenosperma TaxID=217475 RepID=UPI0025AB7753|nr:uncharacterized protein LOC130936045 isoform X2 [Arachis stenosperma]XP_057722000.1 uncharacterized protein LOC130936045 isoform X2 [Arachis stenosperma]XP_057742900.1 uncharacterized protein LOC130961179 isoform X2 [Arachis stenosperma]XP_057742901.1 uncharacterized protein LOC130961179 isoform X2 [Arachis stenosperma]XP_057742902.1 uncharacterized protein LOC130961179 isoform X2 [Arachis stenosperma]
MRLVYASSWAVSVHYAYPRTWKPFNPILGETYEMVNHGGITFLSEQDSTDDSNHRSGSNASDNKPFYNFLEVKDPEWGKDALGSHHGTKQDATAFDLSLKL